MIEDAKLLLGIAALLLAGLLVLGAICEREAEQPAEIWLPLAYAIGLGILGLAVAAQLFLFRRVTPFGFPAALALAGGLSLLGGNPWRGRRRWKGFSFLADDAASSARWAYRAAMLLAAVYLAMHYSEAMHFPMTGFDGRATFALKAKILFRERTLYSPSVTDPPRVHFHADYPPLVPASELAVYELLGKVDDRRIKAIFYGVFVSIALLLYGLARAAAGPLAASALTLAFCSAGQFLSLNEGTANSGSADLPLALFALASFALADQWFREGKRGRLMLAALFAGAALLTKNEGAVVLGVLAAAGGLRWLAIPRAEKLPRLGDLMLALLVAAAIFAPWFIAKRPLPNYNEDYGRALADVDWSKALRRVPLIWESAAEMFAEYWRWNYAWPALFAVMLLGVPRWFSRREYFLDAAILIWLGIYLFVYIVTPFNIDFHLKTSFPRLVTHIFPLALYRIGLSIAALWPGGAPAAAVEAEGEAREAGAAR